MAAARRKTTTWDTTILDSLDETLKTLDELSKTTWVHRGQSQERGRLTPSIDHDDRRLLSRVEMLELEDRSIQTYRAYALAVNPGEEQAQLDPIVALLVMRHYGVPTRVLDWSSSPYVAAYFATNHVDDNERRNGEIWTFDEPTYEELQAATWLEHPETTTDGSGDRDKFDAKLTAFTPEAPYDWFICVFYRPTFPRQYAQKGLFSMTRNFGQDHDDEIVGLVGTKGCRRYIVSAGIKPAVRDALRKDFDVWHGPLFPDSAGAAETARGVFDRRVT
jgi:hypothetical protein